MNWNVYIVRCSDGSLYTGITTDLTRRVSEHNNKTGAKALKGKLPVKIVYSEFFPDRSSASMRESEIKQLSRKEKLELINVAVN